MTDDLDRLVERFRQEDPRFAVAYDAQSARAELMMPIIAARRARGWEQAELARAAGIEAAVLEQIELGDADPTAATLLALARALDLKLEWVEQPRQSA